MKVAIEMMVAISQGLCAPAADRSGVQPECPAATISAP
jgi:hypothetical protein